MFVLVVPHTHLINFVGLSYLTDGLDDRAKIVVGENDLGGLLAEMTAMIGTMPDDRIMDISYRC